MSDPPIWDWKKENARQFKYFEHSKIWAITNKNHAINFKTQIEPKMKIFDFGAFQINMPSPDMSFFTCDFGNFVLPPYKLYRLIHSTSGFYIGTRKINHYKSDGNMEKIYSDWSWIYDWLHLFLYLFPTIFCSKRN